MALLRINAAADGTVHAAPDTPADWRETLRGLLARLPGEAPVAILVHGYRYSWRPLRGLPCHDPHRLLYLLDEIAPCARKRPRTANWPHALGFSRRAARDGLCIALGWDARHWRPGLNRFARVHRTAQNTAAALVTLVRAVASADPHRRVDCLSHSLGARVVIQALRRAPDLPVARAILLGGAEHSAEARLALEAQDRAGGATEFYHMLSRANDVYDGLFQLFAPSPLEPGDVPLGVRGLGRTHRRWLDLQLDHPETRRWLTRQGLAPQRPPERVSHWSFYADPGAMALYRAILRDRRHWSIGAMRDRGLPTRIEPRWSRLLPAFGWRRHEDADGVPGSLEI
jgi:hypothetical protein